MSLLSAFWHALAGDPPAALQVPKGAQPLAPEEEPTRDMMEIVAERRALLIERDCYKLELQRLGYTAKSLEGRVRLYDLALKAEVAGRKSA